MRHPHRSRGASHLRQGRGLPACERRADEASRMVTAGVMSRHVAERVALSCAAITIKDLTKNFSAPDATSHFSVLDCISLTVGAGEFVAIVGPSG